MNQIDTCPIRSCEKSIADEPDHFDGKPASAEEMLRCVTYQMFMLASAAGSLNSDWPEQLRFQHSSLGEFNPSEHSKLSGLISFRILFDFFYNPNSKDDFSISNFADFGATRPNVPKLFGFHRSGVFTKESINKFIAHLTWARINKPTCIPQPKFSGGDNAIIRNSQILLTDADRFVDTVVHGNEPNIEFNEEAKGYFDMYSIAMERLGAIA